MSLSLAIRRQRAALTRLPLGPARAERGEAEGEDTSQLAEVIPLSVGEQKRRARKSRRRLAGSEAGMATAEYAIATLAAVAFAGLLVLILRSGEVRGMLTGLVELALTAV